MDNLTNSEIAELESIRGNCGWICQGVARSLVRKGIVVELEGPRAGDLKTLVTVKHMAQTAEFYRRFCC